MNMLAVHDSTGFSGPVPELLASIRREVAPQHEWRTPAAWKRGARDRFATSPPRRHNPASLREPADGGCLKGSQQQERFSKDTWTI
jgi:hypothetical protein